MLVVVIVLGGDLDLVSHEKHGVEAHAELADQRDVRAARERLDELSRARPATTPEQERARERGAIFGREHTSAGVHNM